jgi:hypothetical protein
MATHFDKEILQGSSKTNPKIRAGRAGINGCKFLNCLAIQERIQARKISCSSCTGQPLNSMFSWKN